MRWWAIFALALLAGPSQASPLAADIQSYQSLAAMDKRVAEIGYRLAAANAPFCPSKQRNPGWVLHSYRQYPDREAAEAAFIFPTPVAISAIVESGPAAKAGLRAGFGLENIGGENIWWGGELKRHVASTELIDNISARIDTLFERDGPVRLTFLESRGGETMDVTIDAPAICASSFWVDTKAKVDAGADGQRIRLTTGLVEFTPDDAELAAVIAHEMAHNLLGHRQRLNATKKGKTKATYATEIEADRLSVWLMANARYDTAAAISFAERFGRKYGLGIFSDGTHPRWKNRVAIMQVEIDLMAATPPTDGLRAPPLLTANRPQ